MSDSGLSVLLLGVISASAVTMTAIVWITAVDLRRVLRRIDGVLRRCDATALEARRALAQARALLTHARRMTHRLDAVAERACGLASDAIDRVATWQERVQGFLTQRFGNGTGAEPRREHRRL